MHRIQEIKRTLSGQTKRPRKPAGSPEREEKGYLVRARRLQKYMRMRLRGKRADSVSPAQHDIG